MSSNVLADNAVISGVLHKPGQLNIYYNQHWSLINVHHLRWWCWDLLPWRNVKTWGIRQRSEAYNFTLHCRYSCRSSSRKLKFMNIVKFFKKKKLSWPRHNISAAFGSWHFGLIIDFQSFFASRLSVPAWIVLSHVAWRVIAPSTSE